MPSTLYKEHTMGKLIISCTTSLEWLDMGYSHGVHVPKLLFIGLAYLKGKDIVFRFIIEYSSLMDFGP